MKESITDAYETTWSFFHLARAERCKTPESSIPSRSANVDLGVFEAYEAEAIAKCDVFVSETLIDRLLPIGGVGRGDEPWLLRRWVRRALATLDSAWPTYETVDAFMRQELPSDEMDHFR